MKLSDIEKVIVDFKKEIENRRKKLSLHRLSICNYCINLNKKTMTCNCKNDYSVMDKSRKFFSKCPNKKW